MKRIKAITIRRILPVILAAAMFLSLLAGCGDGPERASVESEAPTGAPVEDSRGETTLPVGTRDAEDVMISDEELDDIRSTVEMMEESYHYNAEENVTVGSRDWTIYSSPLGREGLTEAEAKFYDRLEELGQRYIATDALNGIQNSNSEWYLTDRVLYGDLGLVREQALNLVRWFLYNNPQYYFFTGATSSNSYYTTLQIYDFVSKGEDRAKVTNELFEKLDGWIQQVDQQAATTYQKELLVNNLLCLENEYEFGEHDQSLYSAVMLGETVCAGFAKAFCAMMNALDVDTTAGLSRNEEENMGHAWNVVRFDDGNFYCVDVCWNNDDESSTGYSNNYLNVGEAGLQEQRLRQNISHLSARFRALHTGDCRRQLYAHCLRYRYEEACCDPCAHTVRTAHTVRPLHSGPGFRQLSGGRCFRRSGRCDEQLLVQFRRGRRVYLCQLWRLQARRR